MTLFESITAFLTGHPDFAGIPLYFARRPDSVPPDTLLIVFRPAGGYNITSHDGVNQTKVVRLEFSSISTRATLAEEWRAKIESTLGTFTGVMGGAGGVFIGHCLPVGSPRLLYDRGLYLAQTDMNTMYTEVA